MKNSVKPKEILLLAFNVKLLRKQVNMSQEELAHLAEFDRTYVSKIERGIANPSINTLIAIAGVFEISFIDLFDKSHI